MATEAMGRVLCEIVILDHNSLHTEKISSAVRLTCPPVSEEEERGAGFRFFLPVGVLLTPDLLRELRVA